MKYSRAILFFILLFFSFGTAPAGAAVIDTAKNVVEGAEFLSEVVAKLSSAKQDTTKNFVVAHFGDSHIQGDHFSGAIRNNLQDEFGNGGEGILFPYSLCKSFGPASLTSSSTGAWTWATVLKNPDKRTIGVTGYTLISTDTTATLSFSYNTGKEPVWSPNSQEHTVVIWYGGNNEELILSNNTGRMGFFADTTDYGNGLRRATISGYQTGDRINFRIRKHAKKARDFLFLFYGLSFEHEFRHGVEYNRCGVVGATFLQLIAQQDFAVQHLKALHPDMLIFSYGSNESYDGNLDHEKYAGSVAAFLARLKKEFPGVGIIVTSPPDTRSGGRFPVNTQWITDSLRNICERTEAGFWDLHGIMGGDKSITYWLDNKLARTDKLHFTKAGYELQGNLFSLAFLRMYSSQQTIQPAATLGTLSERIETQLNGLGKPTGSVSSSEKIHVVQPGESLTKIARDYNVTVDQLCAWNNITRTDLLKVGQKLIIKK